MGSMEEMLMLSGDSSGSDSDDDNTGKATATAVAVTASTASATALPPTATQPPPVIAAPKSVGGPPGPGVIQRSSSKSDLTNRLKNLYGSPPVPKSPAAATKSQQQQPNKPTGPVAAVGAVPLRRSSGGAPATAARNVVATQQPPPAAASSSSCAPPPVAPGGGGVGGNGAPSINPNTYIPPMVHTNHTNSPQKHQQQQQKQQQQPPPVHGGQHGSLHPGTVPQTVQSMVGRVPAPLPKARTSNPRSAPPSNRVASVPVSSSSLSSAPAVNTPSVGPPPPSPLTATGQHSQQQQHPSHGQQAHRKQQYAHAPHLQRGAGTQQHHGQSSRGQQHTLVPPPAQQQQPAQATSSSSSRGNPPNVVVPQERSSGGSNSMQLTDQEKKEKERFLMFTRVLMKYLEQRDAKMHAAAKAQIKECYEKNKSGDPQFKSLTTSMKARLRSTVGENYWKKAHDYLDHFLKQKRAASNKQQQMLQQQQGQTQQQPHRQQPQQQVLSGHPPQQSPSMHGSVPPPIVRTAAPRLSANAQQQQPNPLTQSQMSALAATKTPIAPGSSRLGPGSGVTTNPPATIPVSAPPTTTSSTLPAASQQPTAEQIKAQQEKKKAEEAEAKRKARNEQNRKRRAERAAKKKEKDRLEAEKAKTAAAVASQAAAAASANLVGSAAAPSALSTSSAPAGLGAGNLPTGVGIPHPLQHSASALSSAPSVGSAGPSPTSSAGATPSSTASVSSAASSKAKDKKVDLVKKKSSKKKAVAPATSKPYSSLLKRKSSLTREPSKLMETIDHAVLIDVKSLPTLLSKEHKLDFNLDEEQRTLLYGDEKQREKVKDIAKVASAALDMEMKDTKLKEVGVQPLPWNIPSMYDGWGKKNVVLVRNAWAKVRLPEGETQRLEIMRRAREMERERKEGLTLSGGGAMGRPSMLDEPVCSSTTSLGSGMVGPGTSSSSTNQGSMASALKIENDTTNHVWFNESRAEQDPTLALLSEATEVFLKSTIEKAIGQARLRQNLDGVRLWHTLHARSSANPTAVNDSDKKPPPAALIRLGCDVRRQIALAEGNAAKTYQRMEEAISRQNYNACHTSHSAQDKPDAMLLEATSMADLSKKPPLKSAAQVAEIDAKRKYAVFGGTDSQEPPFGRVPKKAKVILQDIVVDELGNRTSMIGARRKIRVGLKY